jgi:hypothetical protein
MNVAQHSTNDGYWGLDMGLRTELEKRQNEGGMGCNSEDQEGC